MPELPEVEITRRGIEPHVAGVRLTGIVVRERRLRWRVPAGLGARLAGHRVRALRRRGKYLLFDFEQGSLIVHLGMSGSLRALQRPEPPGLHDHVDLVFGRTLLRLRDPRRFGSVLPPASRAASSVSRTLCASRVQRARLSRPAGVNGQMPARNSASLA